MLFAIMVLVVLAAVATAWWQKKPISGPAAQALKARLEALDDVLVPWMGISLVTIPIGLFLPFGDVAGWRIVFNLVGTVGVLLVAIRNVMLTRLLRVIAEGLDVMILALVQAEGKTNAVASTCSRVKAR